MEEAVISQEKENDVSTEVSQRRRPLKNISRAELLALKREFRSKLSRSDVILAKLDDGFDELKVCVNKMANIIEECQSLVKAERAERRDLQYILRETPIPTSCKTNIVNPMVAGIPLKRALIRLKRISLKRLGLAPHTQTSARGATTQTHTSDQATQSNPNDSPEAGPSSSRGRSKF